MPNQFLAADCLEWSKKRKEMTKVGVREGGRGEEWEGGERKKWQVQFFEVKEFSGKTEYIEMFFPSLLGQQEATAGDVGSSRV